MPLGYNNVLLRWRILPTRVNAYNVARQSQNALADEAHRIEGGVEGDELATGEGAAVIGCAKTGLDHNLAGVVEGGEHRGAGHLGWGMYEYVASRMDRRKIRTITGRPT